MDAQAATPPVGLGTAQTYSVLAAQTVTNTGNTNLIGDLGLSPGTAVTGFPPGTVHGTTHLSDGPAIQAKVDLATAYDDAASRTPTVVLAELGGQTLGDGVYAATGGGSLALNGTLTLDGNGDPNSTFIFQTDSTLTTGSYSHVVLINGAQACKVYWQVGSSATLGTISTFTGSILALTSITVADGAVVDGQALARNAAVSLDDATFLDPGCSSGSTSTVTAPAVTSTVTDTSTVTAPAVTSTVTDTSTVTAPAVTSTVTDTSTVTAPAVTSTVTETLPGSTSTVTDTSTVTAPAVTPTVTETLPGSTETLPGETVTETVGTATVTETLPGSTSTVTDTTTVTAPAVTQTVTDTATVTTTAGTGTATVPATTETQTATVTATSSVTLPATTVTETESNTIVQALTETQTDVGSAATGTETNTVPVSGGGSGSGPITINSGGGAEGNSSSALLAGLAGLLSLLAGLIVFLRRRQHS